MTRPIASRVTMTSLLTVSLALAFTPLATDALAASHTVPIDRGASATPGTGVGVWDLYGVSCAATACQVVGMTTQGTGYAAGSSDRGRHWTVERVPAAARRLEDVSYPSASVCVAVGQSASLAGIALVTTNGGHSWSLHMLPGQPRYVTSVSCPTTMVCVALARHADTGSVAMRTQNGGATWSHHALPSPVVQVGELSCPTATVCEGLAISIRERSARDQDAERWVLWSVRSLFTQFGSSAVSLSCPSASTCYALGGPRSPSHSVMKTVNGGASWSTRAIAFRLGLTITCASPTSCVAAGVGRSSVIAERSSNGGASWSLSMIPGGLSTVWKLSCSTVSACLGVGDISTAPHSLQGVTIRTVNGGASWSAHQFQ